MAVILVNTGGFGERIKKEVERLGKIEVVLVSDNKRERRKNLLAKSIIHSMASGLSRTEHSADYSITGPGVFSKWEVLKEKISLKLADLLEEDKSLSFVEKSVESVVVSKGSVLIDGEEHVPEFVVVLESGVDKSGINLDNLYTRLLKKEILPKKWAILGEGPRTVEAASMLADLGCKVYLISKFPTLLPNEETNLQENITALLNNKGVSLFLGASVVVNRYADGNISVDVKESGNQTHHFEEIEQCLRDEEYTLTESVQAAQSAGDGSMQHISITNPVNTRGISEMEVLRIIGGSQKIELGQMLISPLFIYTTPAAATVGYTETSAKSSKKIRVVNPKFRGLFYSVCKTKIPTDYKLVIETEATDFAKKEKVIGLHLFGDGSIDVIKGFAIAMYDGLTPEELLKTIPIHPTSSEEVITG
ncbi:glutathione reductase (NADPH) [Nematocida displodere]|uniref:Glutathione reductase (NADPH) n=1 Tax=Nematocida displodere TaxID=1805483 RepID=A0A177EC99_9MICR|nr:glutathione reductase (NADPH) [Nematocida displodere]